MAWTTQNLRNHDFYARTLDDLRVVLENTTARDLEQYELVILNGYFGEVLNVEDVANGEDAIVNIDSMRTIRTDQVAGAQTFVVGEKIWFDPNGAAVGALYDSEDATDFVAVGIVTAIYSGHANVEFRPFAQDIDMTLVRSGAALADEAAAATAQVATNVTNIGTNVTNIGTNADDIDALEVNEVKTVALPITADGSAGIEFVLATYGLAAGDKIIDAFVICTTSESNGALTLSHTGGNAISDAIACVTAGTVVRVSTLDQAEVTIGAATLKITAGGDTAANTRGILYISYIPV